MLTHQPYIWRTNEWQVCNVFTKGCPCTLLFVYIKASGTHVFYPKSKFVNCEESLLLIGDLVLAEGGAREAVPTCCFSIALVTPPLPHAEEPARLQPPMHLLQQTHTSLYHIQEEVKSKGSSTGILRDSRDGLARTAPSGGLPLSYLI